MPRSLPQLGGQDVRRADLDVVACEELLPHVVDEVLKTIVPLGSQKGNPGASGSTAKS